ncbi:hypothetical protein [Shewanella gelidii]|uniref:Tetratricopeptide repeat protein n=1 Tax=Shewanella gelidii TaxID=1642821 RepID=A0A917JLV3_9GAMM|nr:hypothetical protein [Shewanella gelidii]MCL1099205.1 hypothetical protein [Shewanella gelidii]GGI76396.1 hypothetical protein GCM10009332_12240 [Shewanella gelidii]
MVSLILVLTLSVNAEETTVQPAPAPTLQEKQYRQALYFYFAGDYASALRQVSLNRKKSKSSSAKSNLFEAGLQVSVGLHQQATETLEGFEASLSSALKPTKSSQQSSNTSPQELLLIAQLQLAEQQFLQGSITTARQTLEKINRVPETYQDQYTVLSQLVYWPDSPKEKALGTLGSSGSNNGPTSSDTSQTQPLTRAYIQLNQALLDIEQTRYEQAEALLTPLKTNRWQAIAPSFWQTLFNPFNNSGIELAPNQADFDQYQAVQDYARLLLAQMYVKQNDYTAAYHELKDFPKASPYSEAALFLFAYAAQKSKQFDTSLKLLEVVKNTYPQSHLGWQAALLKAMQIEDQISFQQAMSSYLQAELFFTEQEQSLKHFHAEFKAVSNPLEFAPQPSIAKPNVQSQFAAYEQEQTTRAWSANNTPLVLGEQTRYQTQSQWLRKALNDASLQENYKNLAELDALAKHLQTLKQQSQWLNHTIALNQQRQAQVLTRRTQVDYQQQYIRLHSDTQELAKKIEEAKRNQNGQAFATLDELRQLQKIQINEQRLENLKKHRNIEEYQHRLSRLKSVLQWKMQTELPQRLWQHQKQLKQLNAVLSQLQAQNLRLDDIATSPERLTQFQVRQQHSEQSIDDTLMRIAKLRVQTAQQIHQQVAKFVQTEQSTLAQLLLTTRHKMASALEQMSLSQTQPVGRLDGGTL